MCMESVILEYHARYSHRVCWSETKWIFVCSRNCFAPTDYISKIGNRCLENLEQITKLEKNCLLILLVIPHESTINNGHQTPDKQLIKVTDAKWVCLIKNVHKLSLKRCLNTVYRKDRIDEVISPIYRNLLKKDNLLTN